MVDFKKLRKILNGSNMSVKHYADGKVSVTDSKNFKGMSISALEEAQQLVADAQKADMEKEAIRNGVALDSVASVSKRAQENIGVIIDCLKSKTPHTAEEMHQTAV